MIYVDDVFIKWRGREWCHMLTDGDEQELHNFAKRLGLRRQWYQGDHYDVTRSKRALAIRYGAQAVTAREIVEIRRSKRQK